MRILTGLLAGILLSGLSFEGSPGEQMVSGTVAKPASAPVRPEWRLGPPVSFQNLTIFPVMAEASNSPEEFITLEEGLRSGKVTITEIGQDGRSRRIRRGARARDDADVNKLMLTNNSGKMLLLIAGEVVVGGKQDRIVGQDCLVASTNAPVPINVFCVERGRWQENGSFGQSRSNATASGAQASSGDGGGIRGAEALTFTTPGVIASPDVREKAQAEKDQGKVWSNVSETVAVNMTVTVTGTLNSVYQDGRVKTKVASYERAIKEKLAARNIVGAVAAVGGKIVTADVFATSSLFRAYWPKLLKSYAVQAISTTTASGREVKPEEAQAFLSRVEGQGTTEDKEGVYRLTEHQSSDDASFELERPGTKPKLIHFNRVNKK